MVGLRRLMVKSIGQIALPPLYIESVSIPSLSIKPSNISLHLLKKCKLLPRSIFLLNPNRIFVKCLQYPQFHPTQPNSLNPSLFNWDPFNPKSVTPEVPNIISSDHIPHRILMHLFQSHLVRAPVQHFDMI